MSPKLAVLTASLAASVPLAAGAEARASHTHVKEIGNGGCVVLAPDAGEERVDLPAAVFENNPHVVVAPAPGRNHPLHVLVHRGVPGQSGGYHVDGSAAAAAACAGGYVNR